jgi:hypothetical protein
MRNSRKYVNPSINASRNIFTSIDATPGAITFSPTAISGLISGSVSTTISGVNSPVTLAVTTSNGTFSANHTLQFFKNSRLIDTFTVASRIGTNRLLSEQFNNNDVLTITATDPGNTISYTLTLKALRLEITNLLTDAVTQTLSIGLN